MVPPKFVAVRAIRDVLDGAVLPHVAAGGAV
jgi:hypothetical protein